MSVFEGEIEVTQEQFMSVVGPRNCGPSTHGTESGTSVWKMLDYGQTLGHTVHDGISSDGTKFYLKAHLVPKEAAHA